jgi:CRISPR-associated protein Cmr2
MNFYQRKLYALLQAPEFEDWGDSILEELECLRNHHQDLKDWWNGVNNNPKGKYAQDIASASDRVNLYIERSENHHQVTVRHPLSGQRQQVRTLQRPSSVLDISQIKNEPDAQTVFCWFWRFYPEKLANTQPDALLFPAHTVIPDCPLHSHQSTVSALTGAMFPQEWPEGGTKTPYLLIFSFSPVQEFIKSSRKFLDFWAGSYLLHYLSSRLCWYIAQELGPDAVIVPSLWSQEIIDALIIQQYPYFAPDFAQQNPVSRFKDKTSTSLSTAGFPNIITALVPGKEAAQKLGTQLKEKLTEEWVQIGEQVQLCIRAGVIEYLQKPTTKVDNLLEEVFGDLTKLSETFLAPHRHELKLLQQPSCWEWNKLWHEQLKHTWEPYWAAVPLGSPDLPLIKDKENQSFDQDWIKVQQEIAHLLIDLPSEAEVNVYDTLNVGTWWGSLQQRLRLCLNAVKNTRNWQIPTAPGERSTISGQFSAVHPRLNYTKFAEGAGINASSMRLFWLLISKAFPGLFNGTEKLNALELTKRMGWIYGGVADALGLKEEISLDEEGAQEFETDLDVKEIDYEQLIRFPNLSSIAAARFAYEYPDLLETYWQNLNTLLKEYWQKGNKETTRQQKHDFYRKTRRPFHISKTDAEITTKLPHQRQSYNGVMFSGKWLADDMGLTGDAVGELKNLVDKAHRDTGFGDSSPADWWVIILADGDGMGSYVSGEKLKNYRYYLHQQALSQDRNPVNTHEFRRQFARLLFHTQKRMGPATHVGLNRALLDFSNRLVPYLTEKRFCGRVIYSGGDDVKVVLPLEDLPEYLLSLRAAWCGGKDPHQEFTNSPHDTENRATGYWHPMDKVTGLPNRPHFTMGKNATMSAGVIIAHKSVPLPTVLESLWEAESDRAKNIPGKDGICFRVIYSGGNQLEALMKGELLEAWWEWVKEYETYKEKLTPLLHRLAEELPRRASITDNYYLFSKAAKVIMDNREHSQHLEPTFAKIARWLDKWEDWVKSVSPHPTKPLDISSNGSDPNSQRCPLGTQPEDLAKILRFTAFWVDKRVERWQWGGGGTISNRAEIFTN